MHFLLLITLGFLTNPLLSAEKQNSDRRILGANLVDAMQRDNEIKVKKLLHEGAPYQVVNNKQAMYRVSDKMTTLVSDWSYVVAAKNQRWEALDEFSQATMDRTNPLTRSRVSFLVDAFKRSLPFLQRLAEKTRNNPFIGREIKKYLPSKATLTKEVRKDQSPIFTLKTQGKKISLEESDLTRERIWISLFQATDLAEIPVYAHYDIRRKLYEIRLPGKLIINKKQFYVKPEGFLSTESFPITEEAFSKILHKGKRSSLVNKRVTFALHWQEKSIRAVRVTLLGNDFTPFPVEENERLGYLKATTLKKGSVFHVFDKENSRVFRLHSSSQADHLRPFQRVLFKIKKEGRYEKAHITHIF